MINKAILSFLLLALSFQVFHIDIAVYYYKKNINFYKKKCINKSKPLLNCNGKCQLIKKIQQEEKNKDFTIKILDMSSKTFFPKLFDIHYIFNLKYFIILDLSKIIKKSYKIFHPPNN